MEITRAYLRHLFNYDGQNLIHRISRKRVKAGSIVGTVRKKQNDIVINLFGKNYLAHRLIWIWNYGDCPEFLDHINGDRLDNRVSNLRAATRQQNAMNQKIKVNNTSGFKGVCWSKQKNKWVANITFNKKKNIHLGFFENFDDAVNARKIAEEKYFGEWNRGFSKVEELE